MRVTDMLTQQTRAMSVKTLITLGLIFLAGAAFYGYLWFTMDRWRDFTAFHLFWRIRDHLVRDAVCEAREKSQVIKDFAEIA
jgi:hypothetical protein